MRIEGIVKRLSKVSSSGSLVTPRLTGLESLAVAQVEPVAVELARTGRRFMGGTNAIAGGIGVVADVPTTTAALALYNGQPDGGKSMAIESIHYFLGSGTAAAGSTLLVAVSVAPIVALPTADTNYKSSSCSGRGATSAIWDLAVTFPAGSAWIAVASNQQAAAANLGQGDGVGVQLHGGLIVPPRHALGFAVLTGAGTTPLYSVSVVWDELELDLE